MIQRYEVLQTAALSGLHVGEIVYKFRGNDYGIAEDDTELSGFPHICITMDPSGQGEFISVREQDVKLLND
jgi:hypothetical protein